MRCSIVACTHNGELFLEEQLASFLHQQRLPDEIVICDDASSDASRPIIDSFVRRARERGVDCRAFLHDIALGVTGNFEFGCMQATGDVIFLSDQDDRWGEGKIARILTAFDDPAVGLVNSDARLIDGNGKPLDETLFGRLRIDARERQALSEGDLSRVGAYKNLFTGATMAFRAGLLNAILPLSREVHHDDWIAQITWVTGGEIRAVFEPLMDYRLHSANTIGLGSPESLASRTPSERFGHYLEQQCQRLAPVVERGIALNAGGRVSAMQLHVRKRQLELARRRSAYSPNPAMRFGQVLKAAANGLYAGMFNPGRTAFLDLFRFPKDGSAT